MCTTGTVVAAIMNPSTNPDGKELEYFSRYEPAFKGLQKLVMDKQWLKSMKYYVRFRSVANCLYM